MKHEAKAGPHIALWPNNECLLVHACLTNRSIEPSDSRLLTFGSRQPGLQSNESSVKRKYHLLLPVLLFLHPIFYSSYLHILRTHNPQVHKIFFFFFFFFPNISTTVPFGGCRASQAQVVPLEHTRQDQDGRPLVESPTMQMKRTPRLLCNLSNQVGIHKLMLNL